MGGLLRMLGVGSWKKRVNLATGGWFDMTQSEEIAHGYGYFLYKTQAGTYVLSDLRHIGNFDHYEVSEAEAFQSLVRNGKEPVARRRFPTQYQEWIANARR